MLARFHYVIHCLASELARVVSVTLSKMDYEIFRGETKPLKHRLSNLSRFRRTFFQVIQVKFVRRSTGRSTSSKTLETCVFLSFLVFISLTLVERSEFYCHLQEVRLKPQTLINGLKGLRNKYGGSKAHKRRGRPDFHGDCG